MSDCDQGNLMLDLWCGIARKTMKLSQNVSTLPPHGGVNLNPNFTFNNPEPRSEAEVLILRSIHSSRHYSRGKRMDDVDIQRFSPLSAIPHKKDFPSPQRTPDIVTKHRHRFDLPSLICLK